MASKMQRALAIEYKKKNQSQGKRTRKCHIPSDLVVDGCPHNVEGSSALDFPLVHDARPPDQQ
jgi:hypothetical protein